MAVDVGQIATAAKEGFGVTQLTRFVHRFLHVFLHLWVGLKITVYQLFCLTAAHFHPFSQTKGGDAVDDAEIGRLGLTALVTAHFIQTFLVDLCGGGAVDVMTFQEGGYHVLILTQMGHQPEFNLRIVGGEEQAAWLRHECLTHFLTVRIADRDVLKVRIGRRQTARGSHCLVVGRVNMAGLWVD